MSKTTKDFEAYWACAHLDCPGLEYWQLMRVKRIAFLAWRAALVKARAMK
jgi:hypothetical protein